MEEKLQQKCRSDHVGVDRMPRLTRYLNGPAHPLSARGSEAETLRMCETKGHIKRRKSQKSTF